MESKLFNARESIESFKEGETRGVSGYKNMLRSLTKSNGVFFLEHVDYSNNEFKTISSRYIDTEFAEALINS